MMFNYCRARTPGGGKRWVIVDPQGQVMPNEHPATEAEAIARTTELNMRGY